MTLRIALVHDTTDNYVGGGESTVLTLARELEARGYRTALFTPYPEFIAFFSSDFEPHEVVKIPEGGNALFLYGSDMLRWKLATRLSTFDAAVWTAGYPFLSERITCPGFYYAQGFPLRQPPPYWTAPWATPFLFLHRLVMRTEARQLRFVAVSNYLRGLIEAEWNRRCDVIFPPLSLDEILPLAASRKTRGRIVSVGRFSKEKQHSLQLEILRRMNHPDADLWMVGTHQSGSESVLQRLQGQINNYHLADRAHVFISRNSHDKLPFLASSQVFLHTNPSETAGIAVLEGMAAGCIPCVPDSGGIAEFVPRMYRFKTVEDGAAMADDILSMNSRYQRLNPDWEDFSPHKFGDLWAKLLAR